MSVLDIVAVLAIVGYVIDRQLRGEHLRGKRLILLPVVLVVIGLSQLVGHGNHAGTADILVIAMGAVVATAVGLAQGASMHLEARDGTLWSQMPLRSLALWIALVGSRVVVEVIAHETGARLAASTAAIILTLGINRLAQAAVVAPRALAAGIPFTPEKNGSSFLASVFAPTKAATNSAGSPSSPKATATTGWQMGVRVLAERVSSHLVQR